MAYTGTDWNRRQPMENMRGSRVFSRRPNHLWRFRRSCRKPRPSSDAESPPTSSGCAGSQCFTSSHGMPAPCQRHVSNTGERKLCLPTSPSTLYTLVKNHPTFAASVQSSFQCASFNKSMHAQLLHHPTAPAALLLDCCRKGVITVCRAGT